MTTQSETTADSGRTPSMLASLLVLGVMVSLILLSVMFFGSAVADGPLQVSMTLSTLFALTVALYYGFRGSVISQAIGNSVNGTMGTIFVLLAIGAIIGTLYLAGTVAAFIYYGVELLSPRFYYVTVFIIASVLSMLLGSSLTTVGAVGVPFVGLASIMGVSPAIAAGAAVSGAILGDKTAKISDTALLTIATVGGIKIDEHARTVIRTAIPTFVISALLFLVLGLTGNTAGGSVDPTEVQATVSRYFNVSLLAFVPVILIFVLSMFRFSSFMCLMLPAIAAVVLAGFTQHDLIVSLAGDPSLSYFEAVLKVGIDTLANGFHLNSGVEGLDSLFAGGGTASMLTTMWLILVAASFGAVADFTGMLRRIITPVINWTKGPATLILTTMLTSIGLNTVAADPYVSIVVTARMFRGQYIKERLKPVTLSTAIADSGTMVSGIIPWNVNGALFAGALGLGTAVFAPYTFMAYLTPLVTIVASFLYFRKDRLSGETDPTAVYGKEPKQLPEAKRLA
ncbi:MAG: Na+/H+ antiporter NhaC family protein [Caldilineales bacterium]